MTAPKAVPTVQIDNDRVRVTLWSFAPGAATGWHRHDYDYVITPVLGGPVEIEGPGGARTPFEMTPGVSYFREAGVEHDVIYVGDKELAFIETELKQPAA